MVRFRVYRHVVRFWVFVLFVANLVVDSTRRALSFAGTVVPRVVVVVRVQAFPVTGWPVVRSKPSQRPTVGNGGVAV